MNEDSIQGQGESHETLKVRKSEKNDEATTKIYTVLSVGKTCLYNQNEPNFDLLKIGLI